MNHNIKHKLVIDNEKLITYIKYLESLKYKNEVHKQAIVDLTELACDLSNAILGAEYSEGSGPIA